MKRLITFVAIVFLVSCSDSTTSTSDVDTLHPGSSFAVSSPTSGSSRELEKRATGRGATVTSSASMASKKTLLASLFSATALADCAVNLTILSGTNATCYGPSATYTNHPDGSPTSGSLPGGDLGIWEAADSGSQACAAAQLNGRIKATASYADTGLFGTASMICAARVSGLAKPTIGSPTTVTSQMSGLITINSSAITVSSATLTREADSTDGHEVYVSELVGTSGTTTYTIRMKHIPTSAGNATSRGKISVSIAANDGTKPQNCSTSSATGHTIATSVEYEKSSSTSINLLAKDAQFCGATSDPYVSSTNKTVDLTKKLSGGTPTGWANNANLLAASFNPSVGSGNFAYAWQAGYSDAAIRALNISISESGGAYTGTAFFGFGDDISTATGAVKKMVCNWTGPSNSHTGMTIAQKQVLSKASGASVFSATSSNITYDPVNACESSSATFSVDWTNVAGSSTSRTADTTTMDLVNVSTIASSYTTPTSPTAAE